MISASLITHSGDDLLVVNAARVSFAKRKHTLDSADIRLLNYLAKHDHWSPFAHPQITLHCRAPLFVARQAFKHKVGFVENEVSRRYVQDEPTFLRIEHWRERAEDRKQGSSANVLQDAEHNEACIAFEAALTSATDAYNRLLSLNVAPELARVVLPQATMTEWFWTGSLAAWFRFAQLRSAPDAQLETHALADACRAQVSPLFPHSWSAMENVADALTL